MIISKAEAKAILEPHHDLVVSVIEDAWDEWKAVRACRSEHGMEPVLYNRTISNYIFDAIARRAIMAFGATSVQVAVEAQTFKLHFAGLTARFKKGGEDKLGCSIPTQAALLFMEADGVLPGMPPETGKVEFIWMPNALWTDLDRILVIARDGDRLVWEYEIERALPAGLIEPFPTAPMPSDDAPLVTAKPAAKIDAKRV